MPISQLELNRLEHFFSTVELPQQIQLYQGVKITNVKSFVETAMYLIKEPDVRERVMEPRLDDLRQLKKILEST